MERFRYWITRIAKKKWRECRSFCVRCEYYQECKDDFEALHNDVINTETENLQKEKVDLRNESETIVI